MYAIMILRHRQPPQLLTIFKDRNDFLAAVGSEKCDDSWREATKAFRAVYEVHDEGEFATSLEAIRAEHPDDYAACQLLLRKFRMPDGLAR
jgi:hypothetical protein